VMKELVQGVRKRFVDLLAAFRHGQSYTIQRALEIPDRLKARTIYLLGAPDPWSAALLCPCGCHETIHISLLANDSPSWSLRMNSRNEPTLEPSIWRRHGCKSHFFVRNGRIVWYKRR
jgi:hypothetical protein